MKSYQQHLQTLLSQKPSSKTHEASAIFPFFSGGFVQTQLTFLNYWALKRDIHDIHLKILLRDPHGNLLIQKEMKIDQVKVYQLNLKDWIFSPYPLFGSIEVKFSSEENLVFPYPGVSALYSSKESVSFVHAAQRLYNHAQDEKSTERNEFLESGFNIYASENQYPFVTLINGSKALEEEPVAFEAINYLGKAIRKRYPISALPYQTLLFDFQEWEELQSHLKMQAGTMRLKLCNTHSFPRLIVGNYDKKIKALSVTHTYYDLSQQKEKSDYWPKQAPAWHPMSLSLPLLENSELFSKVYFYPIYSPCSFWVDCEIRTADGDLLKTIPKIKHIQPSSSIDCLSLDSHVREFSENMSLSMRLLAYPSQNSPIAARLKIGYDVGYKNGKLASNVCTNFSPANPALLNKPTAFRWAPLIPQKNKGAIWCLNGCGLKEYVQEAHVRVTYYREKDEETLSKDFTIPPHGHLVISSTSQTEDFLQNTVGWCIFESDNPFVSTYYFALNNGQVVGADHGF